MISGTFSIIHQAISLVTDQSGTHICKKVWSNLCTARQLCDHGYHNPYLCWFRDKCEFDKRIRILRRYCYVCHDDPPCAGHVLCLWILVDYTNVVSALFWSFFGAIDVALFGATAAKDSRRCLVSRHDWNSPSHFHVYMAMGG